MIKNEISTCLSSISAARKALMRALTLQDVLEIRDKAEAIRVYVRAASEGLDTQNAAAEIKLRAERRAGEMLAAMEKQEGRRGNKMLPQLADIGVSKMQSSRWQKQASVSEERFEQWIAECHAERKELTQSGLLSVAGSGHVSQSNGENEWYTPSIFVEAARKSMGSIDLDPASCTIANKVVQAKHFYSIADDGLTQTWRGNVWMNPPYNRELCLRFIQKLYESLYEKTVLQAVILVNNATETAWGQLLLQMAKAICFPSGRIQFISKIAGRTNSPLQGQMIAYCGHQTSEFFNNHKSIGQVLFCGGNA